MPGRNDPCFCGSGKKYKRCCGGNMTKPEPEATSPMRSGLYVDRAIRAWSEKINLDRRQDKNTLLVATMSYALMCGFVTMTNPNGKTIVVPRHSKEHLFWMRDFSEFYMSGKMSDQDHFSGMQPGVVYQYNEIGATQSNITQEFSVVSGFAVSFDELKKSAVIVIDEHLRGASGLQEDQVPIILARIVTSKGEVIQSVLRDDIGGIATDQQGFVEMMDEKHKERNAGIIERYFGNKVIACMFSVAPWLGKYFEFKHELVVDEDCPAKTFNQPANRPSNVQRPAGIVYKKVSSLRITNTHSSGMSHRINWAPPAHKVEVNGFWRELRSGESIGHGPSGEISIGRTWVHAHSRYNDKPESETAKVVLVKETIQSAALRKAEIENKQRATDKGGDCGG